VVIGLAHRRGPPREQGKIESGTLFEHLVDPIACSRKLSIEHLERATLGGLPRRGEERAERAGDGGDAE
jgi:hypothetical protein